MHTLALQRFCSLCFCFEHLSAFISACCVGSLQEGQNRALAAVQEKLDAAHTDLLSARKRHEDDLRQRNNRIEV
jgi:hypothetical protein